MKTTDHLQEFEDKIRQEEKAIKRPTVLVVGYTGTGKTSLIQAVCGKNVVPDEKIGAGLPQTQYFDFYENSVIRFWDSKGLEAGDSETEFIEGAKKHVRELQADSNVDNHVHLTWYAIQGSGARVTPCDLRLIKELYPNTLVLITKNDITRPNQREAMLKVLIDGGVRKERILFCSDQDEDSLKKLVQFSLELLPEAYKDAFMSAQMVDLDAKQIRAKAIIHSASVAAAAVGASPIPISDAAILAPIQLGMLAGLAILYGEPKEGLKATFGIVISETLGILTATSLLKFFPGLGNTVNAVVAAGFTEALGHMVNNYLKYRTEARIKGLPMPEFTISLEALKDVFKNSTSK